MRYVFIDPCNNYTYKGNGFLVILGYGALLNSSSAIKSQLYLYIYASSGVVKQELISKMVWTDGSSLTSNANANSGTAFNRGVMVNGDYLVSTTGGGGSDAATAVECDTLEEAAQLL